MPDDDTAQAVQAKPMKGKPLLKAIHMGGEPSEKLNDEVHG